MGPLRVGPSHLIEHCVSCKEFKTVDSTLNSNILCTASFLEMDLAPSFSSSCFRIISFLHVEHKRFAKLFTNLTQSRVYLWQLCRDVVNTSP